MPKKVIYTIGHSSHPAEYFLELLQAYGVDCVVDVRSTPASQYNPQYNKPNLANFLKENGIVYLHFGKEFGARHTNTALHDDDGKVDFEKVQATEAFRQGVRRLEEGVDKGYFPTLMCAEADPLDCHRFSMIAPFLEKHGFEVLHILKEKALASHAQLESELLKRYAKKLPQPNIFEPDITPEHQLKAAYRLHNQQVGWSPKEEKN
ncbi:MAG: DUF488 domain-containing protein [Saprospiraceae bacterium]